MSEESGAGVPVEQLRRELEEKVDELTRRIDALERELAERSRRVKRRPRGAAGTRSRSDPNT